MPEKGRGRALRAAWTRVRRAGARLLRRGPLHRPRRAAAAGGAADHRALGPGHRHPARPRLPRGARRQARVHLALATTCILRGTLAARFSDAQCGFKAIRADVAQRLLPLVEDTGWFFDTELLVLAERAGLRIHEVPVDWVDDPDSSVDIVAHRGRRPARASPGSAARSRPAGSPCSDLRAQLGRGALATPEREVAGVPRGMIGQLARFAAVGVASTLAYLLLYVLLRTGLGAFGANLVALRRHRRGQHRRQPAADLRRARPRAARPTSQVQGLIVFVLGLALTTGALALLAYRRRREPGRRAARARRSRTRSPPCCASSPSVPGSSAHVRAACRVTAHPHPDPTLTPPPATPPGAARRDRLALAGLLVATAALYLVNLSASGWANDFYAAAVQADDAELGGVLLRLVRRRQRRSRSTSRPPRSG